jgi:hypothetical protein
MFKANTMDKSAVLAAARSILTERDLSGKDWISEHPDFNRVVFGNEKV